MGAVDHGLVNFEFVPTFEQAADGLTKPLPAVKFRRFHPGGVAHPPEPEGKPPAALTKIRPPLELTEAEINMSIRPIWGMPVFPIQLLAHLHAYTRTKMILRALRVCNDRQTTDPDVHVTKLPKELIAMIEDAVRQPISVERMKELAQEYNCYMDRCNGPDHFTAEELLEINEDISSSSKMDEDDPSNWRFKFTRQQFPDLNAEEIRQKVLEKEFDIELMGEIGEEHDRRIQVWEKRWLLPQLRSYSKVGYSWLK
ncbi:hypothetical protein MMC16_004795 [Acarospora aff. strigata]|nr:hypothetical protein [Acarospora aff. strigata]